MLRPGSEVSMKQLQGLIDGGEIERGYVRLEAEDASHFLFVLNGTCFCAGTVNGDRFEAAPFSRFFNALAHGGKVQFCVTGLPLFLCTAVLFRKAPAAQLASVLVDSSTLLDYVEEGGGDAVLVIRYDDARSLAFCHEGKLAILYPALGERIPEASTITQRISDYVNQDEAHGQVAIDLYNEIHLPPAPGGGRRLEDYVTEAAARPDEPESSIVVQLGMRTVFRYPIMADEITVGRGGDNDLALDNLSVSRRHARVLRHGNALMFEDLGSENGLVANGKRLDRIPLLPGDELQLGQYTLIHRIFAPGEDAPALAPESREGPAVEETIALMSKAQVAELEYDGRTVRMAGQLFLIGKKHNANLRIRGFAVGGVHARIERDRTGDYSLRHVGGFSAVKLNGTPIKHAPLTDGDEILIGSQRIMFRMVQLR